MDNRHFDITAEGENTLALALRIAFGGHSKATHWRVDEREGRPRLVFAWTDPGEGWTAFLTPLSAERAGVMVGDWLDAADYGNEPDHDGDNGKGWRVYCENWGHVAPYHYEAFAAVEPAWAMYGK